MERTHRGAEGESLLRSDRGPVVMPQRSQPGWEGEGERAPFLRNEPVKLTPAWEGANLPNDTLNLKGVTMDLAPPKDRLNLIYLTLMFHGVGTLCAWNMFTTAKDYFEQYKLKGTWYQASYMAYMSQAAQYPNLIFNWLNFFVDVGGNLTLRIVVSVMGEVVIFVITVILAMVDTSEHVATFFWFTIISVVLLNALNAVFQNSVYGVAARLPPKYTGAVITGSNTCGVAVALLGWASQTFFRDSLRTAAIYYFIVAILVLLVVFDTYFAMPLNRFFRYYESLQQRTMSVNPALAATARAPRISYKTLLSQCWVQLYNVFMTFFVTLYIYPIVHSNVRSVSGVMAPGTFMTLSCFLTFNLTALLGNISASVWQYPTKKWLFVLTTARLALIPLFLLCNYYPSGEAPYRHMPVLIKSDLVYWLLAVVMGLSHGQASSLSMMNACSVVSPEYAQKAGMLAAATLVTGITIGVTLSGYTADSIVQAEFWKSA